MTMHINYIYFLEIQTNSWRALPHQDWLLGQLVPSLPFLLCLASFPVHSQLTFGMLQVPGKKTQTTKNKGVQCKKQTVSISFMEHLISFPEPVYFSHLFKSILQTTAPVDLSILTDTFKDTAPRDIIPVPLRRVRTTRSSTHSHPFQVSLSTSRTLSHKPSLIQRTCNLWSVLLSPFPEWSI